MMANQMMMTSIKQQQQNNNNNNNDNNDDPFWIRFVNAWKSQVNFNKWTHYLDENLVIVRALPIAVGLFGTVILFRSIRLTTKFTNPRQIPQSFVKKNVQLRGKIADVNVDGTLELEHLPIVQMPWHRLYRKPYFNVRLAYLSPTVSGAYWMKLNAKGRPIKFRVIDRNYAKDQLMVVVKSKELDTKKSLNELLVRNGLAKVEHQLPDGGDVIQQFNNCNIKQTELVAKLHKYESLAKKEGIGMWCRVNGDGNGGGAANELKRWLSAPVRAIMRIFDSLSGK